MPKVQIKMTLEDGELRQAISEWVAKHTQFKLTRYEGIVVNGRLENGTYAFPPFHIEAEAK